MLWFSSLVGRNVTARPYGRLVAFAPETQDEREGHSASPLVLSLFDVLRDRSTVDRRTIYDALVARLSKFPGSQRTGRLLDAMRLCMADLGRAPSRRDYDGWRDQLEDPTEVPHSSQIRVAFGSWRGARQALGEPGADPMAVRLYADNRPWSKEQLIAALRACSRDLGRGRFSFARYHGWAERQAARTPRNRHAFFVAFGDWDGALKGAGLEDAHPGSRPWRRYPSDVVVSSLRAAWVERACDGHLAMDAYDAWSYASSEGFRPSSRTVAARFGSWGAALLAAGLIDEARAGELQNLKQRSLPDAGLLDQLGQAMIDMDDRDLSLAKYKRWRTACQRLGVSQPIASWFCHASRFGTWTEAKAAARARAREKGA